MESITDLLNKHKSDKCNHHTYQIFYDSLFSGYDRSEPLDILEVGVAYGGSVVAWKEYFPNARVTGVDIVDNRFSEYKRPDIEFVLSDIKDYQPDRMFDVIIEDGNHSNENAIWAAINLVKYLKPSGVLVIEDVQEAYMVPFLLWGKLCGDYMVQTLDMRRLTDTNDNFLLVITPISRKRV